jgi:hypothetical protein
MCGREADHTVGAGFTDAEPAGQRFGIRSKLGNPSGMTWKACRSTVKIAACG